MANITSVQPTSLYRAVLREIRKASRSPRATRNPVIASTFRASFTQPRDERAQVAFAADIENAITFMRSQRIHKELLERYNPLFDLTAEERIQATARRVGLNVPKPVEEQ